MLDLFIQKIAPVPSERELRDRKTDKERKTRGWYFALNPEITKIHHKLPAEALSALTPEKTQESNLY